MWKSLESTNFNPKFDPWALLWQIGGQFELNDTVNRFNATPKLCLSEV
jgi:hypothetical protein